eukprot:gene9328-biopygen6753
MVHKAQSAFADLLIALANMDYNLMDAHFETLRPLRLPSGTKGLDLRVWRTRRTARAGTGGLGGLGPTLADLADWICGFGGLGGLRGPELADLAASWRQMAAKRHGGKVAAKLGGKVRHGGEASWRRSGGKAWRQSPSWRQSAAKLGCKVRRGGKASRRQSGSKAWRHGGKASWRQSGGEENLARDRRHAAVEQPAAAPVAHRRRQVDPSPAQRVGELRHPPQQPRDRRAGDLHVEVDRVEGAGDRRPHDEGDAAVAGRDEARRRGDVPVRGARGGEGRRHLPAEVEAGDAPLHRRRPRRPRRDPPPVERRGAALGRRRGAPPFRRVVVRQVEVVLEQDVGDEALPEEAVVCRELPAAATDKKGRAAPAAELGDIAALCMASAGACLRGAMAGEGGGAVQLLDVALHPGVGGGPIPPPRPWAGAACWATPRGAGRGRSGGPCGTACASCAAAARRGRAATPPPPARARPQRTRSCAGSQQGVRPPEFGSLILGEPWRAFGEPGLASLWRALASLWRACLTGEPWRAFGEGSGGVWRAFGEPGLASLWRALASLWRALASLWRAFGEPGLTGEPGA